MKGARYNFVRAVGRARVKRRICAFRRMGEKRASEVGAAYFSFANPTLPFSLPAPPRSARNGSSDGQKDRRDLDQVTE